MRFCGPGRGQRSRARLFRSWGFMGREGDWLAIGETKQRQFYWLSGSRKYLELVAIGRRVGLWVSGPWLAVGETKWWQSYWLLRSRDYLELVVMGRQAGPWGSGPSGGIHGRVLPGRVWRGFFKKFSCRIYQQRSIHVFRFLWGVRLIKSPPV